MRSFVVSLFLSLALPVMVAAQDDAAIRNTIESQIEAFKADDFETAFTYASPSIKGMFGTPENFGNMVRRGYPMVWRPADVRFGELRDVAGGLWQRVLIRDQNGGLHALDYLMTETEDGWKIKGVQILPPPDATA